MKRLRDVGLGLFVSLGFSLIVNIPRAFAATGALNGEVGNDPFSMSNIGFMDINNRSTVVLLITVFCTLGLIILGRHYSNMIKR